MKPYLIILNVLLLCVNAFVVYDVKQRRDFKFLPPVEQQQVTPIVVPPVVYKTNFVVPERDMTFDEINSQLKKWAEECKGIVEYGTYGKTQSGTEIPYLRIGNKQGPKVLIASCIHGNEHLAAMTTMGCIGTILNDWDNWKSLLSERDLYYVPVICPDSYKKVSRHDMGIDPNRNFSDRRNEEINSIPAITSLKAFQIQNQFKAFMSCHNYGKVYLYPWGYTQKPTEIDRDYRNILGKMKSVSGYNHEQLLRQSAPPYYGYEVDWFHKHGAFAVVNEIGDHFQPSKNEIANEVKTNVPVLKIFIDEAPKTTKR